MIFYPYTSPIILTESIFQIYGGDVANSSPAQRQIAYVIAEEAVSRDISSFLLPTVITGTYTYRPYVLLDHAYIQEIYSVKYLDTEGDVYWAASGTMNEYYRLYDDTYGVVDLDYISAACTTCNHSTYPYKIEIAYRAGLPTGTANQPKVLMALTKSAQAVLNELIGWGNEGVGDIGITRFDNQEYSETRMKLINTVYGNSAAAQFIHRMLDGIRKYRHVGI